MEIKTFFTNLSSLASEDFLGLEVVIVEAGEV
jgi:hypothetical protein